jgi:SAM-dependent methyltransferase
MDRHAWDERYGGDGLLWRADPNRFLVAEVAELPPGRALDVACGEGRNAVWLAGQGWTVTGVDFSRVALDKARRLADSHGVTVEWVNADVGDWEPPAGRYDLVVVFYLHLPAERRRAVHARAASALAPGGTMLVVGHDLANLDGGHGGPQDPAVLFTHEDVASDLAGLDIVRAERVRRAVTTDGGEVEAIDALVRAVRQSDS